VRADRPKVGHGARERTLAERAEWLAERLSKRPAAPQPAPSNGISTERVRAAQATANELFAAFFVRNRAVNHLSAEAAVEDLVTRAEKWAQKLAEERERAAVAELLTSLPVIYERVVDGTLDGPGQERAIVDLFSRVRMVPRDHDQWDEMLCVLECSAAEIESDIPPPNRKRSGPVETATFTVSKALDAYGVRWPHRRGELRKLRSMSDCERAMGATSGPFGTSVGPSEAAGFAAVAATRTRRETTELKNPRPSTQPGSVGGSRKAGARAPKKP
jgi:hypothetical protein